MSRKTRTSKATGPKRAASRKKSSKPSRPVGRNKSKAGPAASKGRKAAKRTVKKRSAARTESKSKPRKIASGKPSPRTVKPAKTKAKTKTSSPTDVLARAEADLSAVIDSMNSQMNAAMSTLTELAVAQRGRNEPVIRTAPLDRVTAVFQRLVGEVVEEQLAELLPTIVALRSEMAQRLGEPSRADSPEKDFFERGTGMLDQVLSNAGVREFDAREGEAFDPLIHLAVEETRRDDLGDATVAEWLQPGFRTARGKVITPARVKVNRK